MPTPTQVSLSCFKKRDCRDPILLTQEIASMTSIRDALAQLRELNDVTKKRTKKKEGEASYYLPRTERRRTARSSHLMFSSRLSTIAIKNCLSICLPRSFICPTTIHMTHRSRRGRTATGSLSFIRKMTKKGICCPTYECSINKLSHQPRAILTKKI